MFCRYNYLETFAWIIFPSCKTLFIAYNCLWLKCSYKCVEIRIITFRVFYAREGADSVSHICRIILKYRRIAFSATWMVVCQLTIYQLVSGTGVLAGTLLRNRWHKEQICKLNYRCWQIHQQPEGLLTQQWRAQGRSYTIS